MIDSTKRMTLKKLTGVGIGATALTASANAVSGIVGLPTQPALDKTGTTDSSVSDFAEFNVTTKLSPESNTVQVTISNVGDSTARISEISPARVNTTRGYFDFDALLANGNVHLGAGDTLTIPMQPHTENYGNTSNAQRAAFLSETLSRTMTITTDRETVTGVTVINGLIYV